MSKILSQNDTIYALSTCYGKAGVAIVRISGPEALRVLHDMQFAKRIVPRMATLGKLYDCLSSELVDEAIVIYFPKTSSYTGEDVVELQIHGGIAVINKIISILSSLNYLRLARNGEFTRIALENDKISLAKAESLIELINSETEHQRKVAIRHYNGDLEEMYIRWRKLIVGLLSIAEAYIDFPDDMLTLGELNKLDQDIESLLAELQSNIAFFDKANALMSGITISIIGATNVGKSTLMNILSKSDTSIVSNVEGTTRDVVKTKIELCGLPIIIQDTAGFRETDDVVEIMGIDKSKKAMRDADIVVVMLDVSNLTDLSIFLQVEKFKKTETYVLVVLNKIDKVDNSDHSELQLIKYLDSINFRYNNVLATSLKLEQDQSEVINLIESVAKEFVQFGDVNMITNIRHQNTLQDCSYHLKNSLSKEALELKTEELRYAAKEIGGLLGDITMEEVLDEVFSSFCIGK